MQQRATEPDAAALAVTESPARTAVTGLTVLLALAVFINYVDRGNLATAGPLVKEELGLSNTQFGLLLSAFFWTYAPGQLLGGWLAQRFGVRIVLAVGLAVWSLATLNTGFAVSFAGLFVLRVLLGLGECVFYPASAKLLAERAPEHRRGGANGLIVAGQALGPTFGTLCGGLIMVAFGWRATFIAFGLVSLLWLAPWLWATRGQRLRTLAPAPAAPVVSYSDIVRQPAAWGSSLGSFLAFYGYYLVLAWLPLYLTRERGFSLAHMAQFSALVYGLQALTAWASGHISDRWIRRGAPAGRVRMNVLATGLVGAAAALLVCARAGPSLGPVALVLAGIFFGLQTPQIFAVAQRLGGARAAGKWMAFQNMIGNLAGVVVPYVTGVLVDRTGGYFSAFALASGAALLGVVVWARVIPNSSERFAGN